MIVIDIFLLIISLMLEDFITFRNNISNILTMNVGQCLVCGSQIPENVYDRLWHVMFRGFP